MTFDTTQLIIGLIGFMLGNITGYLAHDIMKKSFNMNEQSSKNLLLITVTLIWAISMLVDVISVSYEVPIAVHGLLGAIVGFFFYRPKTQ